MDDAGAVRAGRQVNLRLFDPERKTTLLFVIRDKSKTPMENLTTVLEKDLQDIWAKIPKPDGPVDKLLTDYFDIEYAPRFPLPSALSFVHIPT